MGRRSTTPDHYRINPFYDLAKVAVNRMAWSYAKDLEAHDATAVSLSPAPLRSEIMPETFGVTEDKWRDAASTVPHFVISETRGSSVVPLQRWPPTPIARAGTASRFRVASLRRSMASPIWTAPAPMRGVMSRKYRTLAGPPTPRPIADPGVTRGSGRRTYLAA